MTSEIVVVPLKKYLVKFIQLDWDIIFELDDLDKGIEYSREIYRASLIYRDFEYAISIPLKKQIILTDANFPIPDSIEIVKKISPSQIRNQKLINYTKKNFQVIKIKIHSKSTPIVFEERNANHEKLEEDFFYKILNSTLEESFNRYLVRFIYGNTPLSRLKEMYRFLGLNENDIKRTTLIRRYHRSKEKYKLWSTKEFKFDKERPNSYFFNIIEDRFKNELSYSQIAIKHNTSKSRVIRICQNEKIKYEYKRFCRGIK